MSVTLGTIIGCDPRLAPRPPEAVDKVLLTATGMLIGEVLRIHRVLAAGSQMPVTVGEIADGATLGALVAGLVMMSPIDVRIGDDNQSRVFQLIRENTLSAGDLRHLMVQIPAE